MAPLLFFAKFKFPIIDKYTKHGARNSGEPVRRPAENVSGIIYLSILIGGC